jgi:hypothetical protein
LIQELLLRGPILVAKYKRVFTDWKRLHGIWNMMIYRCESPKSPAYHHYGGRNISVCEEWHDPLVFYKWAKSNGYKDNLSIDRINNDGDYEPNNCRWATMSQQANNTRKNHILTLNGKTDTLTNHCRRLKVSVSVIYQRINYYGYSVEDAFSKPIKRQKT